MLAAAALVVWVAVTAFTAAHHEPWRDEADPWLVARDADPVTFIRRASLSGTPSLWHLMLVPLARGGAPYESQKGLHLAIAAASVALILWRSPFPWLTKLAIVFSYFFAYEYAVVVRSYALSVLLLLLIAMWYRERFTRPVRYAAAVALLANTNAHSLFVAAFLGLFFAYETLRLWKPLLVMLAGGLIAVAQLAAASGERATTFVRIQFGAPAEALGAAFLPRIVWPGAAIAGLLVIGSATFWLRRRPMLLTLLWCWYAALALIFTFWWIGGVRHAGLILVLLLVVLWIATEEKRMTLPVALLTISLLVADVTCVLMMRADYRYAFSGSKEIADFLRANRLDRDIIAAHSETTTSAVAPYLAHPLWYAGIEEFGSFPMWDKKFDAGLNVTYPAAVARARRAFGGRRDALMLLNVEVPDPPAEGLELLYRTRRPLFEHPDETFWLYRFR